MNRSNYQYPPNPENCCCYCPRKRDYTPRGGRGARYAESSPSEDDEDEDECGNHTFRSNDKTYIRDQIYDNLIDLIDDQMMSTMSTLRKKARKFMKSEMEQSFSSDTSNRRCNCSEDIRSKDTSVVKKANEIDYQPQSAFLKKMVQQYQYKQNDYSELNESSVPATVEKCKKSKNKEQSLRKVLSPPNVNHKEKPSDPCCCTCPRHKSPDCEQEYSQKKSEHVSRGKKKCRKSRKRRSGGICESGDRFEPQLKQPHENSCERCWRFASPSRSPVNKPDQRYDPNFRRGHSCMSLDPGKAENFPETKKEADLPPCKNEQSVLATPEETRNIMLTSTPKRKPKTSGPDKSAQTQNATCEDYSPLFTPLDRGTPLRSQSYEHSKPCTETKTFDFEYPSLWSAESLRTPQQKCTPRPHSCDKVKEKNSLEKGIIYSSKVRNLLTRPQSYIPATCNNNAEEHRGSQQYKDVCGRGRLQNLDPCMKRSPPVKKEDPCQGMDMSVLRGDNSRGSGLENGLNASRGSGLDTGRDDFDKSAQSDIPADLNGTLNASSQKGASSTKANDSKDKSSSKKPSSANKSPKSKSPSKTPRGSPQGSKDRKGGKGGKGGKGDDKKGTCSTNEAQAYFKIPSEPKPPEKCGMSHPVRKCQCYPRVIDDHQDDDLFCCHCQSESKRVSADEVGSPRPNENCCSPRSVFPENSTFQGRLPCPSPSHGYNQKHTLPNIDEYPEQLFDLSVIGDNYAETVLPCPYRSYMNNRPLNNSADMNKSRCERSSPRNGNFSFRNGNVSNRNGNTNVSHMGGNESCPRYENGNMSCGNYGRSFQMNPECGMEYPRKYCVMYMTKGKENTGDNVEVLVEELSQPCPNEKDVRMTNVSEKMTRMFKCPTESMALRFQKGVSARSNVPQKSRVLYF